MLRKKFELQDRDATLLLHVNSLGYHEIYLNGRKVSEDVLSPAVSQLNKRSLSVTYDLTPYAKQGINDLLLWLGRGWYRKAIFNAVHDGPLVKLQLYEIQRNGTTSTLLVTDNLLYSIRLTHLRTYLYPGYLHLQHRYRYLVSPSIRG